MVGLEVAQTCRAVLEGGCRTTEGARSGQCWRGAAEPQRVPGQGSAGGGLLNHRGCQVRAVLEGAAEPQRVPGLGGRPAGSP